MKSNSNSKADSIEAYYLEIASMQNSSETKQDNNVFEWLFFGSFAILFLVTLFHFLFEISGYSELMGLVAPVNKSLHEVVKVGIWPVIVYSIIEYPFIKNHVNNYFLSKFSGILVLETILIAFIYIADFLGFSPGINLIAISHFIGVFAGQYVTYRVMEIPSYQLSVNRLSLAAIFSITVFLAVNTTLHQAKKATALKSINTGIQN